MKKIIFCFLILFNIFAIAQNPLVFQGYFSYDNIKDLSESNDNIYAGAENAVFSKNLVNNDLKTISTINGLSSESISAIYHSDIKNITLIGYENGLVTVIKNDSSIYNAIGIQEKTSIPGNIKKINHFLENNGIVYVSCDFGIVVFDLTTLEFGDTFLIGTAGALLKVTQTTIFNSRIFAATNDGVRSALLANPNLVDFSQWQFESIYGWTGIATFGSNLYATTNWGDIRLFNQTPNYFSSSFLMAQPGLDMRVIGDHLIATTQNHVYVFNQVGNNLSKIIDIQTTQINNNSPLNFSCATIIGNTIYIGTKEKGIITTTLTNPTVFSSILPNGPIQNSIFSITATVSNLWVNFGGYSDDWNPYTYVGYSPTSTGISKLPFATGLWKNIPFEDVLGSRALVRTTVNPNNENQVFESSFFSGLLKLVNDVPTVLYDNLNTGSTGLETIQTHDIRIEGATFDKEGNIWMTNSQTSKTLKVLKANGQWQRIDLSSILANFADASYGRMIIDRNGTKWIASSSDGVLAFNENYSNRMQKITVGPDNGNLPTQRAQCMVVDNRNQLWIGTRAGLRVLSSVDDFLTNDHLSTNNIVFEEDGIGQELMFEQNISDIAVDGANNKWIATTDSGVYKVSANGQQTLYHFTKANSPLPSNTVNDIDINNATGEVFFATDKGLISFKGTSTKPSDDLENVVVFPNPVRPGFSGTVKISGLVDKADVKITDIEGNLVFEKKSSGGTLEWDTTAFGRYKVASGVYMILISSQDATLTKVKKVMIVR